MRRNRYFLGATADDVKEYFDVSAYRNVLDMLSAFDTSITAVANYFHNRLLPMGRVLDKLNKTVKHVVPPDKITGKFEIAGPAFGYTQNFGKQIKVFLPIMDAALEDAGTEPINGTAVNPQLDPYVLVDLARSLEWEMNRLRLPVPHNFRQLNATLSGRQYEFKVTHAELSAFFQVDIGITDDGGLIPAIELLKSLPQVRAAVDEMHDSVRKEIDAAQLAAQVHEETLRREDEDLISREQADKEAEERAAAIDAEKEAQYRQDLQYIIDQLALVDSVDRRNKLAAGATKVLTALASLVGDVADETDMVNDALAQADAVLAAQPDAEPAAPAQPVGPVQNQAGVEDLLSQYQDLLNDMQSASESERQAYAEQLQTLQQQLQDQGVQVQQTPQGKSSVIVPLSLLGLLLFSGG